MNYIGIDIGKVKCVVCVINEKDKVLELRSYDNGYAQALECAKDIKSRYRGCSAVCEVTANMWQKTTDAFEDCGIPIDLANPVKAKPLMRQSTKTDKVDAYILAHLLRIDGIEKSYILPRHQRSPQLLQRHRIRLVQQRTEAVSVLRDMMDRLDIDIRASGSRNMYGPKCLTWLRERISGHADEVVLKQCIQHILHLNAQIEELERKIASVANQNQNVHLLMSITGMDYFGALLLDSEIGDWDRFSTPYKLVSWAGMCPRIYQSGETKHYGRMKKDSNRRVNWLMVQVSLSAIRNDPKMAVIYERARQNHPHAVALTHVARRLIIIAWCMIKRRGKYKFVNEDLYRKKLRRMQNRGLK